MTTNDPKLEELKQRSHDYALWFVDAIFGTLAFLFILAGVGLFGMGLAMPQLAAIQSGILLFVAGSIMYVLLAALRTLKDIRYNTRELLKLQQKTSDRDIGLPAAKETENTNDHSTNAG